MPTCDADQHPIAAALCAIVALAATIAPLPAVAAQPADLASLMQLLSRVQRVEVDYRETLESGLINTSISIDGTLVYEAPDRIRRLSADNRGFALDGDRMELIDDGKVVKVLNVSDIAQLKAMVGALRATFAGDLTTLQADYRLDYRPAADHWQLDLEPRNLGLSGLYQRIEMLGDGATLRSIALQESDGDRRTLRMRLRSREPAELE